MAAVLACGPDAVMSHGSAAALWGFGVEKNSLVEISVPAGKRSRQPGVRVHRRTRAVMDDVAAHEGIPLTSSARTLIDQATRLRSMQLERAVNEADKLGRVSADELHASLEDYRGQPGVAPLRKLLDPLAFRLSDPSQCRVRQRSPSLACPRRAWQRPRPLDVALPRLRVCVLASHDDACARTGQTSPDTALEQLMRPLAQAAELPTPETKIWVNGHEIDFSHGRRRKSRTAAKTKQVGDAGSEVRGAHC